MRCVFINGTVGVGKTTTAAALGTWLGERGIPHAVIDLDEVRRAWPAPGDDPFHHELELANLMDLARNYRGVGATHLVLAGVIEQRSEVGRYAAATDSEPVFICRLRAEPELLRDRLRARHTDPDELSWYLRRVDELAGILDAATLDDLVLEVGGRSPEELASAIARAAGWEAAGPP